ncbi:MAG: hypothetical protein Tsb005_15490 [Gammaproteobacteria bacterium]
MSTQLQALTKQQEQLTPLLKQLRELSAAWFLDGETVSSLPEQINTLKAQMTALQTEYQQQMQVLVAQWSVLSGQTSALQHQVSSHAHTLQQHSQLLAQLQYQMTTPAPEQFAVFTAQCNAILRAYYQDPSYTAMVGLGEEHGPAVSVP